MSPLFVRFAEQHADRACTTRTADASNAHSSSIFSSLWFQVCQPEWCTRIRVAVSTALRARARYGSLGVYRVYIQYYNRSSSAQSALAFDWHIRLDLKMYINQMQELSEYSFRSKNIYRCQIQELTELSVSGRASGCTHRFNLSWV